MANIAVIGAGVVGLSTAINIQKVIPESKVKVIAAEFDNDTTTYGCGGMFFPRQLEHPAGPADSLRYLNIVFSTYLILRRTVTRAWYNSMLDL